MENPLAMSRSSVSTTRSIAVGLLLALVSSGSLVMFSYVAGTADDPVTTVVEASRPAAQVAPVVLGSQLAQTEPERERKRSEAARPDRDDDTIEPLVLGIRVTNPDPEPQAPRSDDRRDRGGRKGSFEADERDPADPPLARKVPSGSCDCDDKAEKRAPNGNAYGYHRNRSGEGGAPPEASEGHGGGTPPGHGGGTPPGHSKSSSSNGGNGHAYGHDKGKGKP